MPSVTIEQIAGTPPVAEATFACAVHQAEAGRVALHEHAGQRVAAVESFVCRQLVSLGGQAAAELRGHLDAADVAALHRMDVELAPFYCPECRAVYCGQCWRTWHVFDDEMPGWLDETRGTCPNGHERMLVD